MSSSTPKPSAISSQNSQGIQLLLEAEREADKFVQNGRAYRIQRLKDAKFEAAKEVEALKLSKMKELAEYEKQHSDSLAQIIAEDSERTDKKIKESHALFDNAKERVIKMLLQEVSSIKPIVHPNFRKQIQ